jgi:FAD dependent oxidoreductase
MCARTLLEPAHRIPISGDYDVVVVGGGIAGVAAALAAVRNGASVCVVEKACGLGGLATLANVVVYLPLCDGHGRQVSAGIAEELLKLSVGGDRGKIPEPWRRKGSLDKRRNQRYRVTFNPDEFLVGLEERVCRDGVALMYDTRFCAVKKSRGRISAIIVENKSGRSAIKCRTVIDASGDADVCAAAGEECVSLETNVPAGWFYYDGGEDQLSICKLTRPYDKTGAAVPGRGRGYRGDDAEDVTDHLIATRKLARRWLKDEGKRLGRKILEPMRLPTIPAMRMTRRIAGAYELAVDDVGREFDDGVGLVGDWRRPALPYAIPYRALLCPATPNLITAGRCISAAGDTWDVTRAIPGCAVTGEAAGTAAAIACQDGNGRFDRVSRSQLREKLLVQGVILSI